MMKDFEEDMEKLVKFMGTDAFISDLNKFASAIKDMTIATLWVAEKLGWIVSSVSNRGTSTFGGGVIPGDPMDAMMHPGGIIGWNRKTPQEEIASYAANTNKNIHHYHNTDPILNHLKNLQKPRATPHVKLTVEQKAGANVNVSANALGR